MVIKAANWSSYQSYKDRKPPWIRLHKSLLDNYEFQSMSADARAMLPMLWLLASEDKDPTSGLVTDSIQKISFRLRIDTKTVQDSIQEIIQAGFFEEIQSCNESVTKPYKDWEESVTPETEAYKAEAEAEAYTPETETKKKNIMSSKLDGAKKILEYLNAKTGKSFRPIDSNLKLITARIKESSETSCYQVIDDRVLAWEHDQDMSQYLRPATIFCKTKFHQYLGNLGSKPKSQFERLQEELDNGQIIEGDFSRL